MGLTATVYHLAVTLSDVDRGVYTALDLRLARHPSESPRYFWLRTLGYCLSYEEGIAFSKGGLSDSDEPPISIRDATGIFVAWIDVGSPSAERLHRASKAAQRVVLYSAADWSLLEREAASRKIHALEQIQVHLLEPAFLEALEPHLQKHLTLELVRSEGTLYVTLPSKLVEGTISDRRFMQ
jgi:uncharacterized protein YaeQ